MNNPAKRQTLQSERSFDSSTGRPTKYFKLDRTYSDVVEDELYDPQTSTQDTPLPLADRLTQPRTERIQNAYPQLFDTPIIQSSDSQQKSDHYWPGMESGIRFDRDQRSDVRASATVIADKKQKLQQQPEQSTVSPKEAFLDYPDNAPFEPKGSVFEPSNARRLRSPDTVHSSKTGDRTSHQNLKEMTTPKTITPVRAHEKLSPKPVFRGQSKNATQTPILLGPSAAQATNNAAANAKIRALYKEESTTSNISGNSEQPTPPSIHDSEPDYVSHISNSKDSRLTLDTFRCEECLETFDRASTLELHARIHARPPAVVMQRGDDKHSDADVEGDEDDDDNDENDEDADISDRHHTDKTKHKTGGPHRCDWIVPSTGQVCGTIFSRPYDLVRHQDTIHRAKKLEFRCEICIAAGTNKIFSRNDALVRHMRHVHKRDPPKRS